MPSVEAWVLLSATPHPLLLQLVYVHMYISTCSYQYMPKYVGQGVATKEPSKEDVAKKTMV